jgi:hypothetical protein
MISKTSLKKGIYLAKIVMLLTYLNKNRLIKKLSLICLINLKKYCKWYLIYYKNS